jgi:hypothetical protein
MCSYSAFEQERLTDGFSSLAGHVSGRGEKLRELPQQSCDWAAQHRAHRHVSEDRREAQPQCKGIAPSVTIRSMDLKRTGRIDRAGGLRHKAASQEKGGLQCHTHSFADQRMRLAGGVADRK